MLKSLDLFSCIGCHAIGFERAGIGTAALCEAHEWRRYRLREQFPDTEIFEDVRTIPTKKADIVFGGPPCQRTSVAAAIHGKRDGESLWPYMLKAGINAGAKWIVVEQPPGNSEWERAVSRDLCAAGFHVARLEYGAGDVGAPYPRRRVYIVGCTSLSRLEIAWKAVPSEIESVKRSANARAAWCPNILSTLPVVAVDAGEMDRGEKSRERKQWIEALGDSNPPEMAEVLGRAIVRAEM